MRKLLATMALLLAAAASQALAEEETLIGTVPKDEAALRALPGAELSEPVKTEDGGRSMVLTLRGAKLKIDIAGDGTQTVEQVDGPNGTPVLCAWQMVIQLEAIREGCADIWGKDAIPEEKATEALTAMEDYIQKNNVVPVTADYVRAERDRLGAPAKVDLAAISGDSDRADICGMALMYVGMAFQPTEQNGPPMWKASIRTPAPVLGSNCN